MKHTFLGLVVLSAVLTSSGCALTEAVTPPPPGIGALPKQAHQLFVKPVPQCVSPDEAGMSINAQTQAIKMDQAQLQVLIDGEVTRWERRRYYLERELRFYEREVRRTGGSLMYTNLANADGYLKVTTDSGFTDQIKRQKEREYNERQHRRFAKHLEEARARHQERMGLYQVRFDQLEAAIKACSDLRSALRKAKEDKELHKHTKPVPNFVPDLRARKVAAMPLPPQEPIPDEAAPANTAPGESDANAPATQAGSEAPRMAETMEELLQAVPEQKAAPATEANQTVQTPPAVLEQPMSVESRPALDDAPVKTNQNPEPASDGKTEKMAETMEELLNRSNLPLHTQSASR